MTETWVEHPYSGGVALIGDAADASDPRCVQGLSITTRDVRVLSEMLNATSD
jgi:2-polyprenyl-6-methoxyphenol hydroxylase-like FAD-dependent oxidoreductase